MSYKIIALTVALTSALMADAAPDLKPEQRVTSGSSFTGRIVGEHVRMRTGADLESQIVRELNKGELVVITGESNDFYAIEPPPGISGYVFRSFVIDNVIEGSRVNVRLAPDRDAPIIGRLSTGDAVNGPICEDNTKWLKIDAPSDTRFYVAKEFVEYAGKPELKRIQDKRRNTAKQLLDAADMLVQTEMRKSFNDINYDRMVQSYKTIITDYADFPNEASKAKQSLVATQEAYIKKKITFLENKADHLTKGYDQSPSHTDLLPADRMKLWEPLEETLYLTWSSMHHAKTMTDFYADQKLKSQTLSGILEPYGEPVRNKPGDYLLKDQNGVVQAFLYSTQIDLQELVGQSVSLDVAERPNNNFAFPAYYVLDAE